VSEPTSAYSGQSARSRKFSFQEIRKVDRYLVTLHLPGMQLYAFGPQQETAFGRYGLADGYTDVDWNLAVILRSYRDLSLHK
jgi:hypothetical protein